MLPIFSNRSDVLFAAAMFSIKKYEKEKESWSVNDHHGGLDNKGKLATFVIHVQYRQNSTWQGKIVWAEKKQSTCFRSALEMIKLMDSAVEEANVDNEKLENQETGGEENVEKSSTQC